MKNAASIIALCVGVLTPIAVVAMYHERLPSLQAVSGFMHEMTNTAESVSASAHSRATLIFVGDMFFDRYIRTTSRMHGVDHPLSCVDTFLKRADMVIGNLEGPITDEDSISEGTEIGSAENYQFTFPSTTAKLLKKHNIGIVDLGNNHIANFGREGQRSTETYLTKAGVGYFGGMLGDEPVLEKDISGVPLSFVSYNAFLGTSSDAVAYTIASEAKKGRTVIVFAHWGEEYSTSTDTLRSDATLFASSGAKFIVGAHPHVVLPHEAIGGVPVYYSLGNFIFDQYWNDMVRHGLALTIEVEDGKVINITEHKTQLLTDGRTCMVVDATSTKSALK